MESIKTLRNFLDWCEARLNVTPFSQEELNKCCNEARLLIDAVNDDLIRAHEEIAYLRQIMQKDLTHDGSQCRLVSLHSENNEACTCLECASQS